MSEKGGGMAIRDSSTHPSFQASKLESICDVGWHGPVLTSRTVMSVYTPLCSLHHLLYIQPNYFIVTFVSYLVRKSYLLKMVFILTKPTIYKPKILYLPEFKFVRIEYSSNNTIYYYNDADNNEMNVFRSMTMVRNSWISVRFVWI